MALYLEVDYYQRRRRVLNALTSCFALIAVTVGGLFVLLSPVQAAPADEFVTTWKTDNSGESCDSCISIPADNNETYSYDVDWDNDGVFDETGLTQRVIHDFGTPGTYTIRIKGQFPRINLGNDPEKLVDINQWGSMQWLTFNSAFLYASNLTVSANDAPNLSHVTDMSSMFAFATSFNSAITNWDVTNVTKMNDMFSSARSFNQSLSTWNTQNVTNMSGMFGSALAFDQDISSWNTSNVTDMSYMFANATSFNQNLSSWDVSNVTNLASIFSYATSFNGNISTWDTGNVTDMSVMFDFATSFNQDLSGWNTANVTHMDYMFAYSQAFNQNLGSWDMHSVQSAVFMLTGNGLSRINYESTLGGWSSQTLQAGIELGVGGRTYCDKSARQAIIDSYSWTFDGDTEHCYDIYLNNGTSGSVEEGMPIGTNLGTFTAVEDFIPNPISPFSLGCTVPGTDDQFFAINSNDPTRLLTNRVFDYNAPVDGDGNNVYEICIRATDSNGNFSERNITVAVTAAPLPPPKIITDATFLEENGKKILQIDGIGFFETGEQEQAFLRSLVLLNGQSLPFCADGTGFTAQELIDLYEQAYNIDITGRVSDNPPCYFLIRNGSPALTSTQVLVWLPDNFDTTAEGTAMVNGSNTYTFNAASPGNVAPTAIVNGDKPLNQTPNVSRRPVFSGVANPGAAVLVSIDGGAVTCNTVADQSGNWSCTSPNALALGTHTVSITVTELGGAVTVLGPYNFTVVEASGPGASIPGAPNTGFMQILEKYRTDKENWQRMIIVAAIVVSAIAILIGVRYVIKKRTTKVTFSS